MEIIPYSDKYKDQVIKFIFDVLENEFERHSKSGRPDLYKITEVYQTDKGNFWVAIDNKNVVGTIALSDCGDGMGFLERMYVSKELRRKGLGSKLLSVLLEFAENKGYERIFLSTWEGAFAANNFYKKNGFKGIKSLPKEILTRSGRDTLFYELNLKR